MNYKYIFKYRRLGTNNNTSFLNKKDKHDSEWNEVTVIGHGPEILENVKETITNGVSQKTTIRDHDNSRMVLYLEDGSLRVIANWQECELQLGQDWVLATKSKMEDEAGRDIKLSVGDR